MSAAILKADDKRYCSPSTSMLSGFATHSGTRYGVYCCFVTLVFLAGGGSRSDILSLVFLRPLSFAILGYALLLMCPLDWARIRIPILFVGALATIMLIQLIPLPPEIWQRLPGRELVVQIDTQLAMQGFWRPATLFAMGTLNSLFALAVPAAALCLLAIQRQISMVRLLLPIVLASVATLALGVVQILGAPDGPFYLYRITNNGGAVGLFANRNHNAMLMAAMIPVTAWLLPRLFANRLRKPAIAMPQLVAITALCLLVFVAMTTSRAGMTLALLASCGTALLWWRQVHHKQWAGSTSRSFGALGVVTVAGVLGLTFGLIGLTDRVSAIDRLFSAGLDGDLRIRVLPYLFELFGKYFPIGSGFGSFDQVYRGVEPDELLTGTYLNHAHNDVLEFLIEGGAASGLLLLAGVFFLVRAALSSWDQLKTTDLELVGIRAQPAFLLALLTLLGGSLTDYPLRVPSLMLVAAILAFMVIETGAGSRSPGR